MVQSQIFNEQGLGRLLSYNKGVHELFVVLSSSVSALITQLRGLNPDTDLLMIMRLMPERKSEAPNTQG